MPNVHAGQPSSRPSTSGNTSSARPVDTSTIPTGSGRGPSSARDSGSTAAASASAASPSGTLIRKIVRQPRPATSQAMSAPPRIGAPTTASPIVGPNAPNALPSSSGGKVALRMPKPCGISIAPSRPCATRKPISMPGEVASPHSADAATNPTSPRRNIRRRPYRSPRRPPVIRPGRERERVARGDPLDHRVAAAQLRADRGGRDAHDRAVDQVHDLRRQHGDQGEPAPSVGGHESRRPCVLPGARTVFVDEQCSTFEQCSRQVRCRSWPRPIRNPRGGRRARRRPRGGR